MIQPRAPSPDNLCSLFLSLSLLPQLNILFSASIDYPGSSITSCTKARPIWCISLWNLRKSLIFGTTVHPYQLISALLLQIRAKWWIECPRSSSPRRPSQQPAMLDQTSLLCMTSFDHSLTGNGKVGVYGHTYIPSHRSYSIGLSWCEVFTQWCSRFLPRRTMARWKSRSLYVWTLSRLRDRY